MNSGLPKKTLILFLEFLGFFSLLFLFSSLYSFIPKAIGISGFPDTLLYGILGAGAVIFLPYIIRRIRGGWNWKDLGFRVHRSWGKDIWFGLVLYALLYLFIIPFSVALLPYGSKRIESQMGGLFQMPLPLLMLTAPALFLLIGFMTGAFPEEILFRGYLQGAFTREIAPAVGFFLSLIFFSLSHYLSHPEWSLLAVLNTVLPGVALCLGYYATGSLLVVIVAHTLANLMLVFPIVLYIKEYITLSYVVLALIGVVFLLLCFIGRREVREIVLKTKELFAKSGWRMSLLGILLGVLAILYQWGRHALRESLSKAIYIIILAAFSAINLGISFLYRNKKAVLEEK